jgi:hypothetical protein
MRLSEIEIQELYRFTRKHYVEHYDVQSELVDHLGNDIEETLKETPKLSFEEAREKAFKKFGIFGFLDVITAKQKQLSKRYRKILWRFVKEWFSFPKLFLTLLIFSVFYTLLDFKIDQVFFGGIMLSLAFIDILLAARLRKRAKNRFQEKEVKYLLEEIIFRTSAVNSILIFSNLFQLSNFTDNVTTVLGKILLSSLITMAIIFSYITLIVIPKKSEELLEETYPEYKMI